MTVIANGNELKPMGGSKVGRLHLKICNTTAQGEKYYMICNKWTKHVNIRLKA